MRRSAVALGAVAMLASAAAHRPVVAVAVEGDYESVVTRIPVKLTVRLSSQDSRAGDAFGFDTTSSAQVEGTFLPAGTHGRGIVVFARPARGPQPGAMTVAAETLDLPNGKKLDVGLEPGQLDARIEGDVRGMPVAVGGAPIVVGPRRSTNIVYERGTRFIVTAPPPQTPAPAASPAG